MLGPRKVRRTGMFSKQHYLYIKQSTFHFHNVVRNHFEMIHCYTSCLFPSRIMSYPVISYLGKVHSKITATSCDEAKVEENLCFHMMFTLRS